MALTTTEAQSAYFPIRVVSSETGVNAITLRAWERRYGLITPKRTAKGHRLYTEDDIRLVKQVVSLLERGIPISQAKAMLDHGDLDPITTEFESAPSADAPRSWADYRDQLAAAIENLDDNALSLLFEELTQFFPVDICLRHLFIPYLERLKETTKTPLGYSYKQFYKAFLHARLAWKIAEPASRAPDVNLLVTSLTPIPSIELLLLAGLLKPLGIKPVYFQGPLGHSDIAAILAQHEWHGALLNLPLVPSSVLLQQLQSCAIESDCPLFTIGTQADQGSGLRHHGMVALSEDLKANTTMIKDMLTGVLA